VCALNTTQHRLTIQTALTVPPSRLTLNNREYLTAPAVLIVCGVLNGGLIAEDALVPDDWNNVPVVIGHPMNMDGQPISARTPEVLAECGVGHVYRARQSVGDRRGHQVASLQAELWLDTALCHHLGGEALQAMEMIDSQAQLELSTAFFSESERTHGSFYGTPYTEIHRVLRPDHLALLPNSLGACDWSAGCGCPRLNHQQACACQTEEVAPMDEVPRFWQRLMAMLRLVPQESGGDVLTIHQTDMDLREALASALAREMGEEVNWTPYFIQDLDIAQQSFTYRMGERLKQRRWTMEDGVLTLAPEIEDVQRETTYTPVPVSNQQEETMPPTDVIKRRVNALIANERTRWQEDDRHMLESQDEAFLIRLEQQPVEPLRVAAQQPTTVQEAIATMPQHLQEPMQAMAQEYEERKAAAIAVLIANKKCPFAEAELQGMTAQRVEQLVTMAGEEVPLRPGQAVVKEVRSYVGRGLPHVRGTEDEDLPPPPPNTFALAVERQKTMGKLAS